MVSFKLLTLATIATTTLAQNTTVPLRYMPFGDSITEIVCWRAKLWEKLQSTEWATVNWVGSGKTENNCKDTKYDKDNEGHSGFLAIDIVTKKQLEGWLKTNPAVRNHVTVPKKNKLHKWSECADFSITARMS